MKLSAPDFSLHSPLLAVKKRHLIGRLGLNVSRIDWAFVFFIIAVSICFTGLTIITYGWATEKDLFMLGFEIAICGFIVGIIDAVLLIMGFFRKA